MSRYQEIVQAVGNLATNRKVGIEMEGNRGYDNGSSWFCQNLPSGWDAYVDSSLSSSKGIEVTTPPMRDLMEVYNGWSVMQDANFNFTDAAGTHVHVDVTDMKVLDIMKLYYFVDSVEDLLFSLVDSYRDNSSWCYRFGGSGWRTLPSNVDVVASYHNSQWYSNINQARSALRAETNRNYPTYQWLALRSETVEWRLFNCVGDDTTGDMAIAFALLAHNTVETVKNSTLEQLQFIVEDVMSAPNGNEAIARFCKALNLSAYPIRGNYAFRRLESNLATRQVNQAQAV